MHEVSLEAPIDISVSIQAEPEPLPDNVQSYSSFDIGATEAPYNVPGQLDISRMRSLLSAQRREREDHIWALREDPGYFSDCFQSYLQHAPELVPDYYGNPHPVLRVSHRVLRQNKVFERIIGDSYGAFIDWDDLVIFASELEGLLQAYSASTQTSEMPPKEFVKVFEKLLVALWIEYNNIKGRLRWSIHGCPRLSTFLERRPHGCKNTIYDTCLELRLTNMKG